MTKVGAKLKTVPVAVIIPTYNRSSYIAQSIQSILGQTVRPAEIVVVDDGSTDDTFSVLQQFSEDIRILHKENAGKSTALNEALSIITQPYVWIFDDDDIACRDALDRLYSALSSNPEAGLSYGTIDKFYGMWPAEVTAPLVCYMSDNRRALYIKLMQDFFIWQGAMLVRTSCYNEVGPFDSRFTRSQDYEMALRLLRRFTSVAVPHVMFHQRHHEGERGPSHARLRARDAEAVWTRFNRLLFTEIYGSHDLNEFLCHPPAGELDERSCFTALLQRGAIMARKGIWDKASADFLAAAALPISTLLELNAQEITALRVVFEHGARSKFSSLKEARAFRMSLRKFNPRLRGTILGNLLLPISNRLKLLILRPGKLKEVQQLVYTVFALANVKVLREYLKTRRSEHRLFGVKAFN